MTLSHTLCSVCHTPASCPLCLQVAFRYVSHLLKRGQPDAGGKTQALCAADCCHTLLVLLLALQKYLQHFWQRPTCC